MFWKVLEKFKKSSRKFIISEKFDYKILQKFFKSFEKIKKKFFKSIRKVLETFYKKSTKVLEKFKKSSAFTKVWQKF